MSIIIDVLSHVLLEHTNKLGLGDKERSSSLFVLVNLPPKDLFVSR